MTINNNKQINKQKIKELPTDLRHHIVQFLDTPSRAATRFTDKQERFPLERHYELALSQEVKQGTSHNVRQNLAKNPNLYQMPETIITTVTNDDTLEVRRNLASNPNLHKMPQEIIKRIAYDSDKYVRAELASNVNLHQMPEAIITTVINDDTLEVRRNLASNPNLHKLPQEIIKRIAYDPDKYVRAELASNVNLYQMPKEIITKLANEFDDNNRRDFHLSVVRENLAKNPNLYQMPQEVISILLNDNESVRSHFAENPNLYKIPQEIFISDYDIHKLHIVRDLQKVENMLDTGHVDDATNLLNSLIKKVNQNDLHGIGEVGHEFRKILSNIVKKSTALYAHNEDTKPLHLMFNLLKAGKLPEFEADDPEEEPDAPFSKHLKEIVDCAVKNTINGNGELGDKLVSLAHTSKTDTKLPYLLKGHEVFRGKDKAMLYRLLSNPTAKTQENIVKMLKQMLPLYDAGHFAEGGTFGVLLPKIVDFIKKNPSEAGFWNVSDLPECDFKTIYKKSWGKLAEMKKNFNLSEPKQSVDKFYNS